jgi:hypothetical protein
MTFDLQCLTVGTTVSPFKILMRVIDATLQVISFYLRKMGRILRDPIPFS